MTYNEYRRKYFPTSNEGILKALRDFAATPNEESANVLLALLRRRMHATPTEQIVHFLSALHDSLSYKEYWRTHTTRQLMQAANLLENLTTVKRQDENRMIKAILRLERLGFSVMPFEIDFDDAA